MRVEMLMSRHGDTTTALDWFVHRSEGGWFLTINEGRDRIRSVAVDMSADPVTHPAAAVAELWPIVRAQEVGFDSDATAPAYIQSEIRVMSVERRFWCQASAWIWQYARVVVYCSHPAIRTRAMSVPDAPAGELAQACFDFAFAFETELIDSKAC